MLEGLYKKEDFDMHENKARITAARGRKRSGRKTVIALGLAAAVLVLALLGGMALKHRRAQPPLKIAGYEIGEEEYNWAMYRARNEVLALHSAAGISPIEWDVRTELGLPLEMVAERTVEILKEFYAINTLAVERGYLQDASFAALEEARQALNKNNQEAIAAGEIVTGLTNYTLERYIDYRTAGLRRQFCYDESNPEMAVTEQELRLRYEQDKDIFYALPDSFILSWIEIRHRPELETQAEQLRLDAAEAGSLAEVMARYPELAACHREESFEGRDYGTYEREYSLLLAYADELDAGEISQVICRDGWIWLLECVQRRENGYVDFDSVAAVVRGTVREERYDALVAQLAGQIDAEYDAEALYRYTARQLS